MSTYSPNLRIELITTGTQAGTWGSTTNTNLGTLIEDAISGYVAVSVISANQALTAVNGAADESRNMTLSLSTTTGANFAVYAPPAEKTYVIKNASSYTATIYNSTVIGNTTAAGTGAAIPAGKTMTVWSDGTNFSFQNTHVVGTLVGDVTGNVTGNVAGTLTGTIASTTTGTTQPTLTNNTTMATTAFVQTVASAAVAGKADTTTTISAGTGLTGGGDLSANRTLAIANTGVTAASYGSGSAIPVLAINAQGQITSASTTAVYPASYSLATSNGASASRSVYLTAGTWQFVLDTRATKVDDTTYNFNTTQSAGIVGVSGSAISNSIQFYRAGGAGYGRTIHGSALAVVSVTVGSSGNYTMFMDAVALNGATNSDGSRITVEKLS